MITEGLLEESENVLKLYRDSGGHIAEGEYVERAVELVERMAKEIDKQNRRINDLEFALNTLIETTPPCDREISELVAEVKAFAQSR